MPTSYTQTEYDNIVLGIADHEVRITDVLVAMKRQDDPDSWRLENELMMLQNVLHALKHYDVDADFLSDDDIYYLHELATLVVQNCPQ